MDLDQDILDFAESLDISKFEKVLMVANQVRASQAPTPKSFYKTTKGNKNV